MKRLALNFRHALRQLRQILGSAAIVAVIVFVLVACLIPARRALDVDPVVVLWYQ